MNHDIEQITEQLHKANSILFVTGSGISLESGIPTYRGIGGLYDNNDKIEGYTIEELMSANMIRGNPGLVWKCLKERSAFCRDIRYNRAHRVIREMEEHFERVLIFTQNVDGLHVQAGSKNIIDIHGDIHNLYCANCGHHEYVERLVDLEFPPQCSKCNSIMRPGVVFFGEELPNDKMMRFAQEITLGFDMAFVVGSSVAFPYVVGPVTTLQNQGTFTVEINPDYTEISSNVHKKISGSAGETLEIIWENYKDSIENPFF